MGDNYHLRRLIRRRKLARLGSHNGRDLILAGICIRASELVWLSSNLALHLSPALLSAKSLAAISTFHLQGSLARRVKAANSLVFGDADAVRWQS